MRHERDGALRRTIQTLINSGCDPGLCVHGSLPAAHALLRMREERVRHALELRRREEAGGAAVVLV
jgi:hypothetical protein